MKDFPGGAVTTGFLLLFAEGRNDILIVSEE
jgi:hypothetical protein